MQQIRFKFCQQLVAAAFTVSTISTAHGQMHGGHDHRAMHSGTPRTGLGASAVFDPHGVLWTAYADGEHVVVRKSPDFGATWSSPVRVNGSPERIESDGDAKPALALGKDGDVYVTWTKPLAKPYTGEIRFARSQDGGKTFTAPRRVHADGQEITHRFNAITVTREGRIFVAWVDKRDLIVAGGKEDDYAGAAIYYAVSDDRGATFRGDFKAVDHSCECCRIAFVPQHDGSVLALWRHVFAPNIRDHALARLGADGRVVGFRRATFDDWRIDACPHHGPSLGVDAQGRLHAVWYSGTPGRAGVYYGRLDSEGVSGQRRIGGETAEHADLATDGERIAIVWKEFDGERSNLRALLSRDGGGTFAEHDVTSTADASDQPRLLTYRGVFYVFWNTRAEPLKVVRLP